MQGSKNSFFTRTEKRSKLDDLRWHDLSSKKVDFNKEARRKANRENLSSSKAKIKF